MRTYNAAIIGATELVGRELLTLLEERHFPISTLHLFDTEQAAGARLEFQGDNLLVQHVQDHVFDDLDLVFFASEPSVSKAFAATVRQAGALMIDASSAFRLDPKTALVVPEVNPEALDDHQGVIATPAATTIQLVSALKPLQDAVGLARVVVSTYQAVSESGREAVQELDTQTRHIFAQRDLVCQAYPHQIAFNCLPHVEEFLPNGYSTGEMALIQETRKVLELADLRITATAVRVPVFFGHAVAVNVETCDALSAAAARALFANTPGLRVVDDPASNFYPLPIESIDEDRILIGRIRADDSVEYGLNLWIVADNLRKGAALNLVHIAEALVERKLI